MERRLNENIQNAHRLRKESNKALEPETNKPKMFQKPSNPQMGLKTIPNQPNSPDYYIDDTPILDEGIPYEDDNSTELHELKSRHEKLVDTILREEDDLIASHHKFIEGTITSGEFFKFKFIK